ncbi:ABC transporter permease [Salipaludibacillus agaradhaerens]|jgi:peptide/nickel transport system permease protein|uniref:ABC transporter permease n=1 Tax=Salipaludibacillus agaradhaerens TaxID=76935 RepID=A0A9Q4B655_SALAG|nr:ABC transporter permease [Salipaludibacillus agaradhaerens]UJW59384.1 ABC transporter permease [Bacillus sp. A116_S68]MCR6098682.1 ABC transporter permease [Salipaludibacillus agaradhaerens]MCR6108351.1 ABC transporter permease [Salipaludibacillus agaradhaerens]MCR6115689.1 ABC transporter permease [Salipaludibacillus agaradhaerens]MCR6120375.1 ABC transporter permease [Salipaludibacillus agaradhaerens]
MADTPTTVTASTTEAKKINPQLENLKIMWRKLRANRLAMAGGFMIIFLLIVSFIGPYFTVHDPLLPDVSSRLQGPSAEHWFGTDHQGRDIFTRLIHGMSLTFYIGFSAVALGLIAGVLIGIIAGYYGRWIDTVLMRIMDVLLAFPSILLALGIIAVLGASLENVIYAVAIFSVPTFARIVRGSTLSVRKLEYVDAVRALGASDFRIIFKHILPNITSPIIVQATLSIATTVLAASGLSFLGLGAQPPTPEWGAMLAAGRNYMWEHPHVALFPGLAIVLVVLAFNVFGDGMRDALDPKIKS